MVTDDFRSESLFSQCSIISENLQQLPWFLKSIPQFEQDDLCVPRDFGSMKEIFISIGKQKPYKCTDSIWLSFSKFTKERIRHLLHFSRTFAQEKKSVEEAEKNEIHVS